MFKLLPKQPDHFHLTLGVLYFLVHIGLLTKMDVSSRVKCGATRVGVDDQKTVGE